MDFNALGDVTLEEQLSCACYEYGRDCAAVLGVVALLERWFPQPLDNESVKRILHWDPSSPSFLDPAFQHRCRVLSTLWGSPAKICLIAPRGRLGSTPYLEISRRKREEGKRRIAWETGAFQADWRQVKTGPVLAKWDGFASFPIGSWGFTNDELVRRFRSWLKDNRPTEHYKTKKGRALVPMDWLKHLAIHREREFNRQRGLRINTPPRCAKHSEKRTLQRSAVEAGRIRDRLFHTVSRLVGCKE